MNHASPNQPNTAEQSVAYEQAMLTHPHQELSFAAVPFVPSAQYEGVNLESNPIVAEINVADNHFAIMKSSSDENDVESVFLVTTRLNTYKRGENGEPSYIVLRSHALKPGEVFDFGRTFLHDAGDNPTNQMSRKQASITVTNDGAISISQLSVNAATEVNYSKQSSRDDNEWEYDPEDTLPREKLAYVVSKEAELAQEDQLISEEMKAIKSRFDDETALNLWRYASGTINKREAQARGDGQGSMNEGQVAGEAYRKLPSEAKEVADRYRYLMERRSTILEQLSR